MVVLKVQRVVAQGTEGVLVSVMCLETRWQRMNQNHTMMDTKE